MFDVSKEIRRSIYTVECNVLRNGCRLAAKRARKKGDYDRVKRLNKSAYNGDVLYQQIQAW